MDNDLAQLLESHALTEFESAPRNPERWFLKANAFDETRIALHYFRHNALPQSGVIEGRQIQQSSLQRGELLLVCCAVECYMKGLAISVATDSSKVEEAINAGHDFPELARILARLGFSEFQERYEHRLNQLQRLRRSALVYPAPKYFKRHDDQDRQQAYEEHSKLEYRVTIDEADIRLLHDLQLRVDDIRGAEPSVGSPE